MDFLKDWLNQISTRTALIIGGVILGLWIGTAFAANFPSIAFIILVVVALVLAFLPDGKLKDFYDILKRRFK